MKKSIIRIFTITLCTLILIDTNVYAYVKITKENLMEGFRETFNGSIGVRTDNVISLASREINTTFNYDISEVNPVFSKEVTISNGISYEDYAKLSQELLMPIYGYKAVVAIQKTMDKSERIYLDIRNDQEIISSKTHYKYTIVDDNDSMYIPDNPDVILESQFGNRVFEYVDYLYGNGNVFTDDSTYIFKYEITESTNTYRKVKTTMIVNLDGEAFNEYIR